MAVDLNYDMYDREIYASPYETYQRLVRNAPVHFFSLPNAGTLQMAAGLQKYQHFSKTQFPTLFQYETWSGANLMIQALQMAGPNPINYSTIFGHDPAKQCVWILRATKERLRDQPPDRLRNRYSGNFDRRLFQARSDRCGDFGGSRSRTFKSGKCEHGIRTWL